MLHLLRKFKKSLDRSEPLVTVRISKANLLHNLHAYQAQFPALTFAPILKSNAYGHGLIEVAEILDGEHIAFFGVDSYFEAKTLRKNGIRSRILVMDYVRPKEIAANTLRDVDFGIVDIAQLRELAKDARRTARVHLKIDTGMHRQGILPADIPEAISLLQQNKYFEVVGIFSHLADGGHKDAPHTKKQRETWKTISGELLAAFPGIEYLHFGATDGMALAEEFQTNTARLGVGLYGFGLVASAPLLKPALEMRTLVTSLRTIPADDTVGYDATFIAAKESRIATVPVGYFEGIPRALSNMGSMQVCGELAPIVGRVSMNMTGLDVTHIEHVQVGDEVIAIGSDSSLPNSIAQIAKQLDRIPYELLVRIPQHLKRVVV